eukprot:CAMPEP_0113865278 /NCGR_PEP_ID=MMETSP0372-20130328/18039_1 /TAXON_ID=340204 /ORGANISM="Lankesteria abbotti" /LENGTH=598 /DNA_ID=CAMNT_0000849045 /DNA_START=239 /DNA_END=2033 /DNA_ORIENTATION=- /assembly_acc=CAM_ASM_000359
MELKTDNNRRTAHNLKVHKYTCRKFRKATLYSTELHKKCCAFADDKTRLQAQGYYLWLRAVWLTEKKDFKSALKFCVALQQTVNFLSRISDTGTTDHHVVHLQREEADTLLRVCRYQLHRCGIDVETLLNQLTNTVNNNAPDLKSNVVIDWRGQRVAIPPTVANVVETAQQTIVQMSHPWRLWYDIDREEWRWNDQQSRKAYEASLLLSEHLVSSIEDVHRAFLKVVLVDVPPQDCQPQSVFLDSASMNSLRGGQLKVKALAAAEVVAVHFVKFLTQNLPKVFVKHGWTAKDVQGNAQNVVDSEVESGKTKNELESGKTKNEVESGKTKNEVESGKTKNELESGEAKRRVNARKAKRVLLRKEAERVKNLNFEAEGTRVADELLKALTALKAHFHPLSVDDDMFVGHPQWHVDVDKDNQKLTSVVDMLEVMTSDMRGVCVALQFAAADKCAEAFVILENIQRRIHSRQVPNVPRELPQLDDPCCLSSIKWLIEFGDYFVQRKILRSLKHCMLTKAVEMMMIAKGSNEEPLGQTSCDETTNMMPSLNARPDVPSCLVDVLSTPSIFPQPTAMPYKPVMYDLAGACTQWPKELAHAGPAE